MSDINLFHSRHFRLEQLSDGVYAGIHSDGGWAISNAGIIDLGDRTIVFDTFMTPAAAKDLRQAAESFTGRLVHSVINSHYHNDHIWGNQVFSPDVDIISTSRTRELIVKEGPLEVQGYHESARPSLKALETQLKMETDETKRAHLGFTIHYFQAIMATLPELQIRLPNLTFTGNMTFEGTKRSAILISYDNGHSGNDAILHLPEDGIVFMADLLFIDGHPYLADGDPDQTQHILAQVKKLKAKTFVPGHGPVGQAMDLDWMDVYIRNLNFLVREAINRGATEEAIAQIDMPEEYKNLVMPNFFATNLQFLYQRQMRT
jgi:glyoxylase-like metal-dependent hydrolase (beta-lactamase superfamily II)